MRHKKLKINPERVIYDGASFRLKPEVEAELIKEFIEKQHKIFKEEKLSNEQIFEELESVAELYSGIAYKLRGIANGLMKGYDFLAEDMKYLNNIQIDTIKARNSFEVIYEKLNEKNR